MYEINHLKKDHEDMFKEILVFEEMINNKHINYFELAHSFQKIISLLMENEKGVRIFILSNISKIQPQVGEIFLDPRLIQGHIRVISESMSSKDIAKIRVALDNDGRMLVSRLKENIFRKEIFFDRILFLHLVNMH